MLSNLYAVQPDYQLKVIATTPCIQLNYRWNHFELFGISIDLRLVVISSRNTFFCELRNLEGGFRKSKVMVIHDCLCLILIST